MPPPCAGDAVVHRGGADQTERGCAPSAANLEGSAAVVMTVIVVIMGIPRFA